MGVNLETAAAECDLIYLAQPISAIEKTLEFLGPITASNCLITDAGSTKVRIVETASKTIRNAQIFRRASDGWERDRGVASASADLFQGRPYILTPLTRRRSLYTSASVFLEWLKRCGANILSVRPEHHDRAVAFTSHLPQMASTALTVSLVDAFQNHDHLKIAGPGLFDMSRLALSSFEIWQDIVVHEYRKTLNTR